MTTKSPWGVGAWAAEAERAEEEEKEAAAAAAATPPPASFPSLKDSVGTKQKKKTKMSMQEFLMGSGGSSNRVGLTHDEMMGLPTRPQERGGEEMERGRIGGGFSNYGNYSGRNRDYGDNEGGFRNLIRLGLGLMRWIIGQR
ncbi:hypothetical protein LIER_40139 [Lithospermum erythrorhizon]|uniref:Uncharacterized protein n=1 Tax=Lithospermum erythrorhizon TaxID=34254 RepID=A0AAV3QSJ8_LITER